MTSPSKKLSAEGQGLVQDFREVVEQAKILLLTKNEGDLLQDFIWQTQQLDGGNASTPNAPLSKDEAKQHGNQALEGLRTLGTLMVHLCIQKFKNVLLTFILFSDLQRSISQALYVPA
jgi:hypothetical protein